jgi:hypothetical protein
LEVNLNRRSNDLDSTADMPIVNLLARGGDGLPHHPGKLSGKPQPACFSDCGQPGAAALRPGQDHQPSGRQALTALGAAGIDYGTTATGRHAGAKTVPTRTLQAAWLECTLHFCNLDLLFLKKMTALVRAADTRGTI